MNFDFVELTELLASSFSERIALRPVALCDAWPLFVATRNPQFNRYLAWEKPDSDELVLKRIRMIIDAARLNKLTALSAVHRQTGEFVGLFRFQHHPTRTDHIEMGVWMHDKFWHGRYSLELGRLCVSGAFALSDRIDRLLGCSAPENRGSCALMAAVGMQPGTMEPREIETGTILLREYCLTRSDWEARHATGFSVFDDDRVTAITPARLRPREMAPESEPMPLNAIAEADSGSMPLLMTQPGALEAMTAG